MVKLPMYQSLKKNTFIIMGMLSYKTIAKLNKERKLGEYKSLNRRRSSIPKKRRLEGSQDLIIIIIISKVKCIKIHCMG